jgi:enamine deaminase RidA (YjgF/YER057c/UK114 family)
MKVAPFLSVIHVPRASLPTRSRQWWDGVLGIAAFGTGASAVCPQAVPGLTIRTPGLPVNTEYCEVWRSNETLVGGRRGAIRYRASSSVLFGCVEIGESETDSAGKGPASALQHVTEAAYRQIFELLDDAGYPGLLRIWNYLPAINAEEGGSERYWQFNAGRQDAFLACGRSTRGNAPAASALGSSGGPVAVYFLALREMPVAIENPRQVSAYDYPPQYGPRSPTFARGSLARSPGSGLLFVSGTASIVGHRTLHHGDVSAQTAESLRNIEAVLAQARSLAPEAPLRLEDLVYKVYVRDPADFAEVNKVFRSRVGADVPALFVQAEVCRSDLLVEIEASGGHSVERDA